MTSYDRALDCNPSYAKALENKADLLIAMKRYANADQALARYLHVSPDSQDALAKRQMLALLLRKGDSSLVVHAAASDSIFEVGQLLLR